MLSNIEKTIRDYLPQVIHMSLATSYNNKPWICEVHFVFDEHLNFYFRSTSSRQHSLEIKENKFVAANVVKQHQLGEKPRGIYFEGEAQILEHVTEQDLAYKLYCQRFGTSKEILNEAKTQQGHKFYKITVSKFYVFDSIESKPSHKYELDWTTHSI